MLPYRRTSSAAQLAAGLAVFAVLLPLLDAGGVYRWAERLELGPERRAVLPAVTALHASPLGMRLGDLRQAALLGLARVGWSDDPLLSAPPPHTPAVVEAAVTGGRAGAHTAATPLRPVTRVHLPLPPLAGAPPLITTLPALPAAAGERTVGLVGDSMMAVGLATTLLREAPRYSQLHLLKLYRSGTGLARPEVFDWQSEYPAMLEAGGCPSAGPQVVIVAMGANDGQGFVDGGTTYAFASPGWRAIYEQRVRDFLALLQARGAFVVWVGLPPMRSEEYDRRMALINQIDYAVVRATPRAAWLSSAGLLGDDRGRFRDFGDVGSSVLRLRQPDGIHLSDEGAALVTARLLRWLTASAAPQTAAAR